MRVKKSYALIVGVIYIFALQCAIMQYVTIFKYWDELYALLCIPLAIMKHSRRSKKKNKYVRNLGKALILFIGIGVVSNCVFQYQIWIAVAQDVFLNLKFFMGIVTTYYLFRDFNTKKYRAHIKVHIKALILFYFVIVVQNKMTHVFPVADRRFGIDAEKIFFNHPTELASATFFLLLMLMICYTGQRKDLPYIIMGTVVVVLTLRFKAIAAMMIFLYMYFIVTTGRKMKLTYFLPLVPFCVMIGWKEFYFYFFSDVTMLTARGAMSYVSLRVARDTFPLGAGFGTFASWPSGTFYSPLYEMYGIGDVWGLSRDWAGLVSDVFWPMIIGQNGFFGFGLYVYVIICLTKWVLQCAKIDKRLYLAGMGAIFYLLTSSLAESAFVNPLALPLSVVIGLAVCVYYQEERKEKLVYKL